jgi:hypothetical protein
MKRASISRFMEKIRIGAGGCWIWCGQIRKRDGYGRFNYQSHSIPAYRAAFLMWRGAVPKGLELDHVCRNRACVSPFHLDAVTHKENMQRSPILGVHMVPKEFCDKGHALTPDNIKIRGGDRRCATCWQKYLADTKAVRKVQHKAWRDERRRAGLKVT